MQIWKYILAFFVGCSLLFGCRSKSISISNSENEMYELLQVWCDGLLEYQLQHESEALNGGIICPACVLIHGRTPDAVYPLLFMCEHTGDKKYLDAAVRLFYWGKNNVRFPDGSWSNEVNLSDWRGITVFGLITLAESFLDFSYLMDSDVESDWYDCVKEQADFIARYIEPGVGSINYSMSACYALALASEITKIESYKERAADLATIIPNYFTPNEFFVYGEGEYPYVKSAKGLFPIDLGYNVEETLPNLLLYAELVNDGKLKDLVRRSIETHIEFMLPDGAWDNSWGTRNFKWTYWGSRTSDGALPLCAVLAKEDPVYAEIGYRNFELLKKCTADSLLYGGCHYISAGYDACVHHTFDHAKGLAMALKAGFKKPQSRTSIPREEEYGVKQFKDIDVWNVSYKGWKATVTGYDADYKMLGGNPHGGTLSLLWHEEIGPLLASGMMSYSCIEPANMQMNKGLTNYPSNLELRYEADGKVYRNVCFRNANIAHECVEDKERIRVGASLETLDYKQPDFGPIELDILYEFSENIFSMRVDVLPPNENIKLNLFVPLISQAGEAYVCQENECRIQKEKVSVDLLSDKKIDICPVELNRRAFCPVPGFEFLPFNVPFKDSVKISIEIH